MPVCMNKFSLQRRNERQRIIHRGGAEDAEQEIQSKNLNYYLLFYNRHFMYFSIYFFLCVLCASAVENNFFAPFASLRRIRSLNYRSLEI